jgi:type I restriction enzyme S subunit
MTAMSSIPSGYKQTEVGVIPEDWNVAELGDIGECLIGLTYKPSNVKADGTLVLRSSNVQDGSLSFDDNVYVDADIPSRIRVLDGDILVCVRNGSRSLIGKCALLDNRVVGQTFGAFMSVYRTDDFTYVFQQFQSALIKRQITENIGATINQMTNRNLNSFKIPFPTNTKERETIATALSDVDALLAAQDKLIAKKRDIKQATMQQLLTGQQRLPGFQVKHGYKQTELGMIPEDWNIQKVGDIAAVGRGRVISHREISAAIHSTYPVYSSQTSNNGIMGCIDTYDFEGEYITWTTDGEKAGTVFYRNGRFNCTNVCGIIQMCKHNALYVSKVLGTLTTRYVSRNLANPKLMNDVVKQILLPLPPTLDEQTAIATILSDMDADLAALEQQRDKTRALKLGMMQELLTGRIRLI